MWMFLNEELIEHTEFGLRFEKKENDIWQLTNESWHKAVSQSSSQSIIQWIRQTRSLEIECSLWALNRDFSDKANNFRFPEAIA